MTDFEDMSAYAVHFTTPDRETPSTDPLPSGIAGHLELVRRIRTEDTTGYHNVMSILGEGYIRPFEDPHGAGADIPELAELHRSAALSEIPLHLLDRLTEHRSLYGVGFRQEFVLQRGGSRVWYLEEGGNGASAVQALVDSRQHAGVDPDDPLWRITPFIEFPRPGEPFQDWRWEREWRVPRGLRFEPADVAFLFIPEMYHEKARQFFVDAEADNAGPAYLCPYIDPCWDRSRITAALEKVTVPPQPSPGAGYDPIDDIHSDIARGF
jgi:hypothetical protein